MNLTGTVVMPLGSPEDAKKTAEAVIPHIDTAERVVLVHVVEKAGGAPDKASVEQREEYADEIFETAEDALSTTGIGVETSILYGTAVPDAVFELCDDVGASSVALLPRETNPLVSLLVGDRMRSFVEKNDLPVVVLPGSKP